MLFSTTILKNSIERYKNSKEYFTQNDDNDKNKKTQLTGFELAFAIFLLIISIIFLILELILLYFAVSIAMKCSNTKAERIVNFIMAVTFTLPYVLIKTTFDPCSKKLFL